MENIAPLEVNRDQSGTWIHPVYKEHLDSYFGTNVDSFPYEEWEDFQKKIGLKVLSVELPLPEGVDDSNFFVKDVSMDMVSSQQPTPDHFLVAIYDGNDGPSALWAISQRENLANE